MQQTTPRPWPCLGAFSYGFSDLETLITSFTAQGLQAVQLAGHLIGKDLFALLTVRGVDGAFRVTEKSLKQAYHFSPE